MIMDYTVLENLLPDETHGFFYSTINPVIFVLIYNDPGCGSCTSESRGFYEDVRGQSLPPEPPDSEPTNARGKLSYLPVNFICRNVFGKVFILRLILTGSDFKIIIKYYQLTFLHLFFCTKDDFHLKNFM